MKKNVGLLIIGMLICSLCFWSNAWSQWGTGWDWLPSQSGHVGQFLGTNGATPTWATPSGGLSITYATGYFPIGTQGAYGISNYALPLTIATGDIWVASGASMVAIASGGASNVVFGRNSSNIFGWYQNISLDDSAAQIYSAVDNTKRLQFSPASSTAGVLTMLIASQTATANVIIASWPLTGNYFIPAFASPATFTGMTQGRTYTMPDINGAVPWAATLTAFQGNLASRTFTVPDRDGVYLPAFLAPATFTLGGATGTVTSGGYTGPATNVSYALPASPTAMIPGIFQDIIASNGMYYLATPQMYNTVINNYGQNTAATAGIYLPTAMYGMHFRVMLGASSAGNFNIIAPASNNSLIGEINHVLASVASMPYGNLATYATTGIRFYMGGLGVGNLMEFWTYQTTPATKSWVYKVKTSTGWFY